MYFLTCLPILFPSLEHTTREGFTSVLCFTDPTLLTLLSRFPMQTFIPWVMFFIQNYLNHSSIQSSSYCLVWLLCCLFNSRFLFFCERLYISAFEQFTELYVWILHWVIFRPFAFFGICLCRISLMKHHPYGIGVFASCVPHFCLVVVFLLRTVPREHIVYRATSSNVIHSLQNFCLQYQQNYCLEFI